MKSYLATVQLVKKLLELITRAIKRQEAKKRQTQYDQIKENPEDHHSDMYGDSSGRVSIDKDD